MSASLTFGKGKLMTDKQIKEIRKIINAFMTGKDIDWSDVETVFIKTEFLIDYYQSHKLSHS